MAPSVDSGCSTSSSSAAVLSPQKKAPSVRAGASSAREWDLGEAATGRAISAACQLAFWREFVLFVCIEHAP